jgi:chromosome partitioning protein
MISGVPAIRAITIANQKGGVGKTTTAVNLAASMGLFHKKTLLIDVDPQGNATSGLGISKKNLKNTSYNVLIDGSEAEDAIIETDFESLYIIPSSLDLAAADIEMVDLPERESRLKNALVHIKDDFEYIIIDCPPSIGLVTTNALNFCDSIIIPAQCEFYSLEGISQLTHAIERIKSRYNPQLKIEGVLLTMYDGRLKITEQVAEELRKHFPGRVFKTVIHRGVRLSEAPSHGQPAFYFCQNCKGSQDYIDLAEEIENRYNV